MFTREELQLVADLCIQHNTYALSDEVIGMESSRLYIEEGMMLPSDNLCLPVILSSCFKGGSSSASWLFSFHNTHCLHCMSSNTNLKHNLPHTLTLIIHRCMSTLCLSLTSTCL